MSKRETFEEFQWRMHCINASADEIERMAWEARARLAEVEDERKRYDLALQSLTPGGSEFVADPDRCVAFARDEIAKGQQARKDAVKAGRALAEVEAVVQAVRRKADAAEERAATMQGIPNDIDRAEGYANGLDVAARALEATLAGKE